MAHWDFIQLLCLCFASEIFAGLVAGTYSGVNYGLQQALGENNWKTTLLSGALTGATLALTEPNPRHDRVVRGALTGGAIATAAAVVRNLTD